jgi:ATP-dependent Clp protease, protease subunit
MKNQRKPTPFFRAATKPDGTLELLIYEDIGADWWTGTGVTAKSIKQEIDSAGAYTKIVVRINSPGGDAFEGVAIFNVLRTQGKPVEVFVDGIAASAASIVAMCGDTRVMGSGAMLMIHNAWSSCVGYADDMRKMADTLDKVSASVADIYVERAGLTADKAAELMNAESWLNAAASVELGLATGVAGPDAGDATALALARSFKALKRLKAVPPALTEEAPKDQDGCSCYCAGCTMGNCPDCNCSGCDSMDCENTDCLCASNTMETAVPLSIFEQELEAIELTLRT